MATRCKPLLDSDWPAITRLKTPNKSLDASGGAGRLRAKAKRKGKESRRRVNSDVGPLRVCRQ
jgi:hypothetical protein